MTDDDTLSTISAYNQFADAYVKKIEGYAPLKERDAFSILLPSGGRILDAGCGPGRDSAYFISCGFQTVGVDLSDIFIDIARKNVPKARFYKQNLRKITLRKNSFDGIWACASLLHLKRNEVMDVLKSFFSLLRNDGVLVVIVKEGKGEGLVSGGVISGLSRFFTYFEKSELESMLLNVGFKIEKVERWNQKVRWPERPNEEWITAIVKKAIKYETVLSHGNCHER